MAILNHLAVIQAKFIITIISVRHLLILFVYVYIVHLNW